MRRAKVGDSIGSANFADGVPRIMGGYRLRKNPGISERSHKSHMSRIGVTRDRPVTLATVSFEKPE